MLLCTVRHCHLPLKLDGRRLVCPKAHSFDIARSGYINLLQPQDRRSKDPGDSAEIVAARRRLHDRGVTQPLLEAIKIFTTPTDQILEAGCGDGFYAGNLGVQNVHGVDISTPAIDLAARRYKHGHWLVANADRFLPYADASFDLVMSIAARMNSPEFHRILKPQGRLLVAVPAPDDIIELRGTGRTDRVARTVETFATHFRLVEQTRATTTAELDADSVKDVLLSIYRPLRSGPVGGMRVTFSLDLLLFAQ